MLKTKKYFNNFGGFNKINDNISIFSCPNDCNNISEIFEQLSYIDQKLRKKFPGNIISIIVPGNAGRPGGSRGARLYDILFNILEQDPSQLDLYNTDCKQFIKENILKINNKICLTDFDGTPPVEELIISKWLDELDCKNIIYLHTIGLRWGLYKYIINGSTKTLATDTLQNIDYTKKNNNPYKYNLCFSVRNIITDNSFVDLLFTFAPNYNSSRPTLKATCDPNTDIEYKKLALKNCIYACLKKAKPGYIILPHLGSGVNKCYLDNDKDLNKIEYMKIVVDVCNFEEFKDKFMKIYVMFYQKKT